MNNRLYTFIIFMTGAVVGSFTAWWITQKKYKEIFLANAIADGEDTESNGISELVDEDDDEIDFEKDIAHFESPEYKAEEARQMAYKEEHGQYDYSKILKKEGYSCLVKEPQNNRKETINVKDKPYVIAPEEFDTYGYDTVSLTYYNDKVMTDEWDNLMDEEEIEATVGLDAVNHFGDYEDDSVFVRNDILKIDYEILLDYSNYNNTSKTSDDE